MNQGELRIRGLIIWKFFNEKVLKFMDPVFAYILYQIRFLEHNVRCVASNENMVKKNNFTILKLGDLNKPKSRKF